MSLHLLRLSLYAAFLQPSLRFELLCICAPNARGSVHGADGDCNELARANVDTVNHVVISCLERFTQGDYIIFRGLMDKWLDEWKMAKKMYSKSVSSRTKVHEDVILHEQRHPSKADRWSIDRKRFLQRRWSGRQVLHEVSLGTTDAWIVLSRPTIECEDARVISRRQQMSDHRHTVRLTNKMQILKKDQSTKKFDSESYELDVVS